MCACVCVLAAFWFLVALAFLGVWGFGGFGFRVLKG